MTDLNQITLIGRLVRDAALAYTSSGIAVCKFSIAVSRGVKKGDKWEEEPNFFDIVLFGRRGEALNQYLLKGKQIGVSGELRQERWTDKETGQNKSRIEIAASAVQLLGGGNNGSGENRNSSGQSGGSYSGRQSAPPQREEAPPSDDGFTDDIPF